MGFMSFLYDVLVGDESYKYKRPVLERIEIAEVVLRSLGESYDEHIEKYYPTIDFYYELHAHNTLNRIEEYCKNKINEIKSKYWEKIKGYNEEYKAKCKKNDIDYYLKQDMSYLNKVLRDTSFEFKYRDKDYTMTLEDFLAKRFNLTTIKLTALTKSDEDKELKCKLIWNMKKYMDSIRNNGYDRDSISEDFDDFFSYWKGNVFMGNEIILHFKGEEYIELTKILDVLLNEGYDYFRKVLRNFINDGLKDPADKGEAVMHWEFKRINITLNSMKVTQKCI